MDHLDSFYSSKEKRARLEIHVTGENSHNFCEKAHSELKKLAEQFKVFTTGLSTSSYQDLTDSRVKETTADKKTSDKEKSK